MAVFSSGALPPTVGRYVLHGEIASGGMATVHFGRLRGAAGFARSVAIKRLHPQFAKDPDFVAMFIDEARLAARIAHPNVVPTLDIVSQGDELLLVMEYVRGASLSRLLRALSQKQERFPPRIVTSIVSGVLRGLHAAHEARNEAGERLDIVHRDVSPQNVLVGTDGVARVLDFGVAKAAGRCQSTRDGQLKGKLAYMAPEQITTGIVTRKTDLYAAAVVLWEALTGTRLFFADNEAKLLSMVLDAEVRAPSTLVVGLPPELDRIVMKGLQRDPAKRFDTAREMAAEVERSIAPASSTEVGEWVERLATEELRDRANRIGEMERVNAWTGSHTAVGQDTPGPRSATVSSGLDGGARVFAATPLLQERLAVAATEFASEASRPATVNTNASLLGTSRWALFAAAALVICAIGAMVLALRASRPIARPAEPTIASAHRAVAASATSTAGTSDWVPVVPTAVATQLPISTVVATPLPPQARPAARPGPARPPEVARPPPVAPRAGCNPPYTTDDKGHVHFKPWCMN